MPKKESDNLTLARQILAGRKDLSSQELYDLASGLREENQIGYSRRILSLALPATEPDLHNKIQLKLAFSTYRDPDLPVDERLKKAEAILQSLVDVTPTTLPADQQQEALGLLGAVFKQRWSAYGHINHLEKSLRYYRRGYDLGIRTDLGYTAINAAFVLDLLADAERDPEATVSAASTLRHEEAAKIRREIVTVLPGVAGQKRSVEDQWWFHGTLGEAHLGLREFEEARECMRKAAEWKPENWRLESTVKQIAHIVRLQAREDGVPPERLKEAKGFAVLSDLLGGSAEAASSFFLGKVGLALSGGGFRASLYHLGVLACLAEADMLRHVEAISCVSGGSILGTYYYLEVRNLLRNKTDAEITPDDYIEIVRRIEREFLQGVQRNLRTRMLLEFGSNWKVLTSRTSTTTDRLADLYERDLYSRVKDENGGNSPRFINDLLIVPRGTPEEDGFDPRYENWRRVNKVPILILNATTLNTCHTWQFTATFMGEAPIRTIDSRIDGNDRLRRMYYDEAPLRYRRIRLGQAVAASACVPGLFDPLVLDQLYPEYVVRLVDGGVYDNQGVSSLLEQDCTVMLVSDAAGQTAVDKQPGRSRIGVSLRTNYVLLARSRQEQYQLLTTLFDAGLLRGVAYVHLKMDLDAEPVDWLDCPDPSTHEKRMPLTSYGIRKDVQKSLAAIRTDLDSFSDAEADALMLSGYRMMNEQFRKCISGFSAPAAAPVDWRFRAIEKLAGNPVVGDDLMLLRKTLDIAHFQALKPYRLSKKAIVFSLVIGAVALAAVIGLLFLARPWWRILRWPLIAGAVLGVVVVLAERFLRRNPNPMWQIATAFTMLFLGRPLTWIVTRWLDPIFLRSGPRYRT
jgi:predicted acylesterase/phospholipase RssA